MINPKLAQGRSRGAIEEQVPAPMSTMTKVAKITGLGMLGVAAFLRVGAAAAQTPSGAAPERGESAPVANDETESGPPEDVLAEEPPLNDGTDTPAWYVKKEEHPYIDVFGAWGWSSDSYLLTICPFNMYLHKPGAIFGFHGRLFTLGFLSFDQRHSQLNGTSSQERKTTFVFEIFDPGLRAYLVGPVFFSFNLDIGAAFYNALVPTLDLHSGFGFEFHGWGLEAGARTNRLPRERVVVHGDKFVQDKYGLQLYLAVETNIGF